MPYLYLLYYYFIVNFINFIVHIKEEKIVLKLKMKMILNNYFFNFDLFLKIINYYIISNII